MGGFSSRSTVIGQHELASNTSATAADFATAAKCPSATDYGYAFEPWDVYMATWLRRSTDSFMSMLHTEICTSPDVKYPVDLSVSILVIHTLSGFVIYNRMCSRPLLM